MIQEMDPPDKLFRVQNKNEVSIIKKCSKLADLHF